MQQQLTTVYMLYLTFLRNSLNIKEENSSLLVNHMQENISLTLLFWLILTTISEKAQKLILEVSSLEMVLWIFELFKVALMISLLIGDLLTLKYCLIIIVHAKLTLIQLDADSLKFNLEKELKNWTLIVIFNLFRCLWILLLQWFFWCN